MKKNPRRITQEEKDIIKEMYLSGMNISEIAKLQDRYPDVIRKKLIKMGVYNNPVNYMTEDEYNQILFDYKSGMTTKELSKKYNRSDGYIINKLKKAGEFTYTTNRLKLEDWNQIAILYKDGNIEKIKELYPTLSMSSIYSKMSKLNITSGAKNWWSDEDSNLVYLYYMSMDLDELYDLIEHRHSKDAIQSYAFDKFGFSKSRFWSKEEDTILINSYSFLPIEDVLELLPNRTLESLRNRAKKLKLISYYRIENYWNEKENCFLINNWKKLSDYQIGQKLNKTSSSVKERRQLLGLYRNSNDLTNYKTIKELLRRTTWNWREKSKEACNYKCVLTGSTEYHVHHLYGFNDIFLKFIKKYNYTKFDVIDYLFDELIEMCNKFKKFHNSFSLGICIRPDIHMLFHSMYGKHNNTPEQWEEFKNNYSRIKLKIA